mmetsp:Transcript_36295/g.64968  ORF Transcript_36295/g.64968 Transcript_36295/m.64968 type:complete len:94 (-) Transcript_36295:86-367(-)
MRPIARCGQYTASFAAKKCTSRTWLSMSKMTASGGQFSAQHVTKHCATGTGNSISARAPQRHRPQTKGVCALQFRGGLSTKQAGSLGGFCLAE